MQTILLLACALLLLELVTCLVLLAIIARLKRRALGWEVRYHLLNQELMHHEILHDEDKARINHLILRIRAWESYYKLTEAGAVIGPPSFHPDGTLRAQIRASPN